LLHRNETNLIRRLTIDLPGSYKEVEQKKFQLLSFQKEGFDWLRARIREFADGTQMRYSFLIGDNGLGKTITSMHLYSFVQSNLNELIIVSSDLFNVSNFEECVQKIAADAILTISQKTELSEEEVKKILQWKGLIEFRSPLTLRMAISDGYPAIFSRLKNKKGILFVLDHLYFQEESRNPIIYFQNLIMHLSGGLGERTWHYVVTIDSRTYDELIKRPKMESRLRGNCFKMSYVPIEDAITFLKNRDVVPKKPILKEIYSKNKLTIPVLVERYLKKVL